MPATTRKVSVQPGVSDDPPRPPAMFPPEEPPAESLDVAEPNLTSGCSEAGPSGTRPPKRRHEDDSDDDDPPVVKSRPNTPAPPTSWALDEEDRRISEEEVWQTLEERRVEQQRQRLALEERRLLIEQRRLAMDERRVGMEERRVEMEERMATLTELQLDEDRTWRTDLLAVVNSTANYLRNLRRE